MTSHFKKLTRQKKIDKADDFCKMMSLVLKVFLNAGKCSLDFLISHLKKLTGHFKKLTGHFKKLTSHLSKLTKAEKKFTKPDDFQAESNEDETRCTPWDTLYPVFSH